jgi:hypothetical protein
MWCPFKIKTMMSSTPSLAEYLLLEPIARPFSELVLGLERCSKHLDPLFLWAKLSSYGAAKESVPFWGPMSQNLKSF